MFPSCEYLSRKCHKETKTEDKGCPGKPKAAGTHTDTLSGELAENYVKWEQKKITSAEFKSLTGLKKGTFYNLIKQYRRMLSSAKEASMKSTFKRIVNVLK